MKPRINRRKVVDESFYDMKETIRFHSVAYDGPRRTGQGLGVWGLGMHAHQWEIRRFMLRKKHLQRGRNSGDFPPGGTPILLDVGHVGAWLPGSKNFHAWKLTIRAIEE